MTGKTLAVRKRDLAGAAGKMAATVWDAAKVRDVAKVKGNKH